MNFNQDEVAWRSEADPTAEQCTEKLKEKARLYEALYESPDIG